MKHRRLSFISLIVQQVMTYCLLIIALFETRHSLFLGGHSDSLVAAGPRLLHRIFREVDPPRSKFHNIEILIKF